MREAERGDERSDVGVSRISVRYSKFIIRYYFSFQFPPRGGMFNFALSKTV
ncbi:hypothetical protein SAMN05428975_3294 [Mucilaginibacter sp. OK268]|nr:hypothetical protein SAMN05428975_3294 [Mucilaginibacter sp. OK268]